MTYLIAFTLIAILLGAIALKKYNKELTSWALSKQKELKSEGVKFPAAVERKVAQAAAATDASKATPGFNKFGVPVRKAPAATKRIGRKAAKLLKQNNGSVA